MPVGDMVQNAQPFFLKFFSVPYGVASCAVFYTALYAFNDGLAYVDLCMVRLEIRRPRPSKRSNTCFRPSNSILAEFPAILTCETLKSSINPEFLSRTVYVPYLAL